MAFQDKILTCVECGQQFAFTAGEQEFYAQKGFTNEPKRCKGCKALRRAGGGGAGSLVPSAGGGMGGTREMHEVTCSACGQKTTVPFKPILDRPVYCRPCYQARRPARPRAAPYS